MQIQKKFFPKILRENDANYFSQIEGVISSVDELSNIIITRNINNGYIFRIAPSLPKYTNTLIEELIKFHNLYRIKMNMSKSIKTSGSIVFSINL